MGSTSIWGSSSGEIPYVIGDAGLTFEEGDVADLVDCIERLIKDKDLREDLIIRGINRVRNNYTWDVVAMRYINFFKELINDER